MIFGILMIILVGVVAFYHYIQGFFSSIFSAICAVLAAALAMSLHEPAVTTLLRGKMSDYANGLLLVALFALIYIILRAMFDNFVPGQVRLPAIVDKIGGGAVGLIAAIFSVGILAIAAQSMPFGPSILGYARQGLSEEQGQVPVPTVESPTRPRDADINNELASNELDPDKQSKLLFPVDDIVVDMVQNLSDGGSLAGSQKLTSVHPNFLLELFGQRLLQVSAKHTAFNMPGGTEQAKLAEPGIFTLENVSDKDAELPAVRRGKAVKLVKPTANETLLALRVIFTSTAADIEKGGKADGLVRIAPAQVRLCVNGKNYFPIGTYEASAKLVMMNKPDDTLFILTKSGDHGADFVFKVPTKEVISGQGKDAKIADDAFLEVKRLARIDLKDKPVSKTFKPSEEVQVLRKKDVMKPPEQAQGGAEAQQATAASPFKLDHPQVSAKLFSGLNVGVSEADAKDISVPWGSATLKEHKLEKLTVNGTQSITLMKQGNYVVDDLYEPPGKKIVQLIGTKAEGGDGWAWAESIRDFVAIDADGNQHKINGAFTQATQQGQQKMIGAFDADNESPDISKADAIPVNIYLLFVVPTNTHLTKLAYKGQPTATFDAVAQ